MSDDYRKPAKPDTPRQKVVRQAEPPSERKEITAGIDPRDRALLAAYAEDVRVHREASLRNAAIGMRLLGGVMLAFALIVLLAYREELAMTGTLSVGSRSAAVLGLGSTLGPWFLAFGNGGVATMHESPLWYRWGAGLLALFGMLAMVSGAALQLLVALVELTL